MKMAQKTVSSESLRLAKDEEEQPLLKKKKERKGKLIVAVIALSNLCAWGCISIIAPFFPIEAEKKGTSETVVGIIYAVPELVIFLLSPVCGKLLLHLSPRFLYITGLFVFGCCDVIYGWLNLSPPGVPFIALCFAVRIVGAAGTAAIMTASFAIAATIFPDRIGTVYAILETVAGVGFLIGPAIGGALYEAGGFGLPFWVFGGFVFICIVASFWVLPSQTHVPGDTGISGLKLFRSPTVWFGSVCLAIGVLAFAVWEPVFTQFLEQFSISQSIIGLIFVVPSATYALTTPLWGYLLDKNVPGIPVIVIGLCSSAVCMLFFGPPPFLTFIKPMLWLTILTIALLGLCLAPVIVSSMRCIVEGARELGFSDDGNTFGIVGGIVQSVNCFGTFVGPMMGGALTDKFGFGWTMTVTSVLLILPVICFSPYLVTLARRKHRRSTAHHGKTYVVLKSDYSDLSSGCQSTSMSL